MTQRSRQIWGQPLTENISSNNPIIDHVKSPIKVAANRDISRDDREEKPEWEIHLEKERKKRI